MSFINTLVAEMGNRGFGLDDQHGGRIDPKATELTFKGIGNAKHVRVQIPSGDDLVGEDQAAVVRTLVREAMAAVTALPDA